MKPRFARHKTLRFESLERRTLLAVGFLDGVDFGSFDFSEAIEISGLAAGSKSDVLWSHNDSGDSARLFATDKQGNLQGVFAIPNAVNVDWEDLAMGSDNLGQDYIFVGDIGDNARHRENITVYRVVEPDLAGGQTTIASGDVMTITLTYPDSSARNAEGLMVDQNNDIYIISKTQNRKTPTEVFRAAYDAASDSYGNLTYVTTIDKTRTIVGADMRLNHAGQVEILVMDDFAKIQLFTGDDPASALSGKGETVPHSGIADTEAIAWDSAGNYWTTSEGTTPPLYFYERTGSEDPPPNTPTLSIDDVTVIEGTEIGGFVQAVFTVTLSQLPDDGSDVTVNYEILDKTTTVGEDYVAVAPGTLTFNSNTGLTWEIIILIHSDSDREKTETFEIHLYDPVGAELARSMGIGTIRDDDRRGGGGGKPR